MNGFLAVGRPDLIYHSTDAITWVQKNHRVNGSTLVPIADDGNGHLVTAPVGSRNLIVNDEWYSSADDGASWVATLANPVTLQNTAGPFTGIPVNGTITSLVAAAQSGNLLWDGAQFVGIADNAAAPFLDAFSGDLGATWLVWGQTGVAGGYVPNDLEFFGGVYVGFSISNPAAFSLIWSPTAGKNAGPIFPGAANDWTVGQALVTANGLAFLKNNGTYILAWGALDGGGDTVVYKSLDGKAWSVSAPLNGLEPNNGKDSLWWDATLGLWIFVGFDNTESGIWSSADGLNWINRLSDPTFALQFNSVRRTGWFLSAVGAHGIFYTSTDGITWTALNAACPGTPFGTWNLSFIHSFSDYFIALGTNEVAPFQQALLTSLDGINWTNRQNINVGTTDSVWNLVGPSADALTSYINVCTGAQVFPPGPPVPPPARCVDFEIESPGDMPDSGQQFTCQRLLLTLNTAVEGLVPQLLTPVLIIDGVEHTLPPVQANGRQTLDIPIYGFHGRFFDGVRLTGCLDGDRVEVFRIEATIALGT